MKQLGIVLYVIGTAWIGYVYLGYPLLLMILGLFRRIRTRPQDTYFPFISVLIAARNEEKDIEWKVNELLNSDYPAECLEVLVASDASEDRTDDVLARIRDPRLKWLRLQQRGGKARALNELVRRARGEVLFLTDANAHVRQGSLRLMARHFADARVGCVTGDSYSIPEPEYAAIGDGASVYWGYESQLRKLESRLGSVLVCDGAIFCIRRKLYTSLSPDLANDLELPMRIADLGYLILHEPEAVVWEHDTSSSSEEFARRRRICGQGALGMWRLRGTLHGIRGWQFVSHKALRWLTLIPLAAMFGGSMLLMQNVIFRILLVAQTLFYACAVLAWWMHSTGRSVGTTFAVPFYVVLGAWGSFCGVIDACMGRRFDIWEIPTQSRGRSAAVIGQQSITPAVSDEM